MPKYLQLFVKLVNLSLALETGGHKSALLDTTEFVYLNGTIVYGPKLPYHKQERHCMVALNDYEVMIIGASNDPHKRKTITYNHADGSYTDGPDLAEKRQVSSLIKAKEALLDNS